MKSITVLKLKLDPGEVDLSSIAVLCRRARNAAAEDWLLRQRGKPESERQSKRLIKRKGCEDKSKSESTKIYHAIVEAVPELGTFAGTMLAAALSSHLSAKVDWRRGTDNGKRKTRKDAILCYEDRPPFFTAMEIPVHNQQVNITFGSECKLTIRRISKPVPSMTLDVSLRKLPTAIKRVLHELASGARKLQDSRILERGGEWYWYLPVSHEAEQLNPDVEAILSPSIPADDGARISERPFRLLLPDDRTWYVGDGRYLWSQTARMEALRKQIGWRYRQRNGAGHGRQKIDAAMRKRALQMENIRDEVRRRAIADVVRQCERAGVGTLTYREPTGPAKERCWFAKNGLDWDWTRFVGDLKNACARRGIAVKVVKLKIAEVLTA